ncbi:MAG TPA: hypothetical protein VFO91_00175 [Anaerolineales bacterium]|nr:hypothetical protein [Anaerolineales bacterium]
MNIRNLIKRIRNSLRVQEEIPNEAVLGFLRILEDVREEELHCSEIYSKLDEYVEREVSKKDAAQLMPLIREHLDICPECCEEYEALLDVLNENTKT